MAQQLVTLDSFEVQTLSFIDIFQDVLSELKTCLSSDDALQYAQYVSIYEHGFIATMSCKMSNNCGICQKL